jgi:imidazole glycerol-phosphate synthase subunit HisH
MLINILDIGFGNIASIKNALDHLEIKNKIINKPSDILNSDSIILPGDGSFKAIKNVYENRYFEELSNHANKNKPILGICLGMQFFAKESEEDKNNKGFNWIPGTVKKLKSNSKIQVPHIGYNSILPQFEHPILKNIETNSDFYFVHSYYFKSEDSKNSLALTTYGETFSSIIIKKNIVGVQFHPEKSQQNGLIFLKNFYEFSKNVKND